MADFSIVVFYLFQVNNLFKNLKKFRSNFYHKTRLIFLRFFRRKIHDEKNAKIFAFSFFIVKSLVQLSISHPRCVILRHILENFFRLLNSVDDTWKKTEHFEHFHFSWYKSIRRVATIFYHLLIDIFKVFNFFVNVNIFWTIAIEETYLFIIFFAEIELIWNLKKIL